MVYRREVKRLERCLVDGGSALPLVIAVLSASVLFFGAATSLGNLLLVQGKLQASADLAAIAGNQTLRGLNTGIPCDRARQLVQLNMGHLTECSIVGDETTVAVNANFMGIVLNATATAVPN